MKLSSIIAIIAIASVLIFFIWSYAAPGSPSWLIFIAAGLGIIIASGIMNKNKEK